jgi:hypothetical protein
MSLSNATSGAQMLFKIVPKQYKAISASGQAACQGIWVDANRRGPYHSIRDSVFLQYKPDECWQSAKLKMRGRFIYNDPTDFARAATCVIRHLIHETEYEEGEWVCASCRDEKLE